MAAAKKQTMTWDATTDQKLLLAILSHYGDIKLDFAAVSAMMIPNCTPRALQERIKKLRKDAKVCFDDTCPKSPGTTAATNGNGAAAAAEKGTAAKPGRKKAELKTKRKKEKDVELATGDEKGGDEKPGSKSKKVKVKKETAVGEMEEKHATVAAESPRKKRKYNAADAVDPPISETIGSDMADAMHHIAYQQAV